LRYTANSLDAGIDGGGFFVLERDGRHLFTRAGQFEFDDDGVLVDRTTGAKVLVTTDTDSAVPFNLSELRTLPPTATTEVQVSGTLARSGTASTFDLSGVNVIDTSGNTIALKVKFTRDGTVSLKPGVMRFATFLLMTSSPFEYAVIPERPI
jgi:flagellar hook protein FlgE